MTKGRHIDIMGIVNLTDDSFYAESRCCDTVTLMERVAKMVREGATILDFGAEPENLARLTERFYRLQENKD